MILEERFAFRHPTPKWTIEEAVGLALEGYNFGRDSDERTQAAVENCVKFLSSLTQMLADSGTLTEDQVLQLLPGFKKRD